ILYAPTWRENNNLDSYLNLNQIKNSLKKNQILIFRGHHAVVKKLGHFQFDDHIVDMTLYPKVNDLLAIADVLITDYSSIMIDYSILERPIILYLCDYESYSSYRGLYFNLKEKFPENCVFSEEEL